MKLISDQAFGIGEDGFVGMGVVSDSGKDYICLLDVKKAKEATDNSKKFTMISIASDCCYVEEIHWGTARNLETATSDIIDNDQEWEAIITFIMKSTTIFSPKKIKEIIEGDMYFYSTNYKESEETSKDFKHRKKEGLI